jgi:hypothetical protein
MLKYKPVPLLRARENTYCDPTSTSLRRSIRLLDTMRCCETGPQASVAHHYHRWQGHVLSAVLGLVAAA